MLCVRQQTEWRDRCLCHGPRMRTKMTGTLCTTWNGTNNFTATLMCVSYAVEISVSSERSCHVKIFGLRVEMRQYCASMVPTSSSLRGVRKCLGGGRVSTTHSWKSDPRIVHITQQRPTVRMMWWARRCLMVEQIERWAWSMAAVQGISARHNIDAVDFRWAGERTRQSLVVFFPRILRPPQVLRNDDGWMGWMRVGIRRV